MKRWQSESGATLIMIVGVIATLAILAASLVVLTVNVQSNTTLDRTQTKSFNVAEAGLDAGQAALWVTWPTDAAAGSALAVDEATIESYYPASDFASPTSGDRVDVVFYDDDGDMDDPGIRREYNYDQNANNRMWIESRGAVGGRASKVMALVSKETYDLLIKEGVALFTESDIDVRGTGNQPVIAVDPPVPATGVSVYAQGDFSENGNSDVQAGITVLEGSTMTMDEVFPDEILQMLIETAQGAGKVYPTQADVPDEDWSTTPRIIVIESGGADAKGIPDTDPVSNPTTVWTEDNPGVLIILDGDFNQTGQHKTIYGVIYLMDGMTLGGNAEVHGMVVAKGIIDMHGTRSAVYNQNVIHNLNKPITLSVKLVENTWREIQP